MGPRHRNIEGARTLLALFPAAALGGCSQGVLAAKGPVGAAETVVLFDALAIMLLIAVPTVAATLVFAWWFRASNKKAHRAPHFTFSGQLELLFWAAPLLTIMFLGGLTWVSAHQLDPYRPLPSKTRPLEVQVVSLDWKWLFIYPDQGIASVNELTAPVGVPIHFTLTSASVMNAFFVPGLGGMIYTMNGMSTQLNLTADRAGVFPGLSSHFSGDGFAGMHFDVNAVAPEAFGTFVAGAKAGGPVLDAPAYAALARQSFDVKPFTYRAVAPGLYQAVATQAIAPAPGPAADPQAKKVSVSPKLGGR